MLASQRCRRGPQGLIFEAQCTLAVLPREILAPRPCWKQRRRRSIGGATAGVPMQHSAPPHVTFAPTAEPHLDCFLGVFAQLHQALAQLSPLTKGSLSLKRLVGRRTLDMVLGLARAQQTWQGAPGEMRKARTLGEAPRARALATMDWKHAGQQTTRGTFAALRQATHPAEASQLLRMTVEESLRSFVFGAALQRSRGDPRVGRCLKMTASRHQRGERSLLVAHRAYRLS